AGTGHRHRRGHLQGAFRGGRQQRQRRLDVPRLDARRAGLAGRCAVLRRTGNRFPERRRRLQLPQARVRAWRVVPVCVVAPGRDQHRVIGAARIRFRRLPAANPSAGFRAARPGLRDLRRGRDHRALVGECARHARRFHGAELAHGDRTGRPAAGGLRRLVDLAGPGWTDRGCGGAGGVGRRIATGVRHGDGVRAAHLRRLERSGLPQRRPEGQGRQHGAGPGALHPAHHGPVPAGDLGLLAGPWHGRPGRVTRSRRRPDGAGIRAGRHHGDRGADRGCGGGVDECHHDRRCAHQLLDGPRLAGAAAPRRARPRERHADAGAGRAERGRAAAGRPGGVERHGIPLDGRIHRARVLAVLPDVGACAVRVAPARAVGRPALPRAAVPGAARVVLRRLRGDALVEPGVRVGPDDRRPECRVDRRCGAGRRHLRSPPDGRQGRQTDAGRSPADFL
ncbi:MAG: Uncharacterized amino acid permease, GabP family, partial [uncultured Ramlibacter sp.]